MAIHNVQQETEQCYHRQEPVHRSPEGKEESTYIFYLTLDGRRDHPRAIIDDSIQCELWKPSLLSVRPTGMGNWTYWFRRWLMHNLRMYSTQEYSILTIRQNGRLVHRSVVYARYFRTRLTHENDLAIGSLWTDPEFRRTGLAVYAVQEIIRLFGKPGRRFWYITRERNPASIRVAEKAGLVRFAEGWRRSRLRSKLLGAFVPDLLSIQDKQNEKS
jgi:RimJ/RimL family protein N-acetyltransferase